MPIGNIINGESGLSARGKINQVIDFIDAYNVTPPSLGDILGHGNFTDGIDIIMDNTNPNYIKSTQGNLKIYFGDDNILMLQNSTALDDYRAQTEYLEDSILHTVINNALLQSTTIEQFYNQLNFNSPSINYGGTYGGTHSFIGTAITYNGLPIATENYVDNLIAGLKFKQDVVAASTGNVNISSAPTAYDSVTPAIGDRILLKDQTNQTENGCYIYNGAFQPLTRATDSNTGAELVSATYPVKGGATHQDTWYTVTNDTITIGVTNIIFSQVAGSGTYTVGSYLKLTGNVFDIDFTTFDTNAITEGTTNLFFTDARARAAVITQTITNGVTDRSPSENAVFDALALKRSTTTEMLLFSGAFSNTNLAASTTYYWSNMNGMAATTTQNFSKFNFANNFTVTKVVLTCSHNNNPSSGNTALYIRESATTDKTITTTLDLNTVGANTSKVFVYSGLSLSVTSGKDYEIKTVTPAMVTVPTNCRWHIQIWGY